MGTVVTPVAPLLLRAPLAPSGAEPDAQGQFKTILAYHRELAQDPSSVAGYVMELGYDAGVVITNDYYKLRVGGLPKNCFLLIRPGPLQDLVRPEDAGDAAPSRGGRSSSHGLFDLPRRPQSSASHLSPHLILARVTEPAATPLAQDVARTYFE